MFLTNGNKTSKSKTACAVLFKLYVQDALNIHKEMPINVQ